MGMLNNLKTLLIPRKGSNKVDDLDTNWRAIEVWARKVGSFYASLTGPGETASPGALTQLGGFTVSAGSEDIELSSNNLIQLFGDAGAQMVAGTGDAEVSSDLGNVLIHVANTNGGHITISGTGPANNQININEASIVIGGASDKVGFFGSGTTVKPTVSGSRGGNAALASLLTVLSSSFGLINDSTTP